MRWLAMVITLVAAPYAKADDPGEGYGVGMQSCAVFASSYKEHPTITEETYFSWAQGFISALNADAVAYGRPYRKLGAADPKAQKAQIRSFCDQHPLKMYAEAVLSIYAALPFSNSN